MRYAQRGGYTPAEQRRKRLRLEAAGRAILSATRSPHGNVRPRQLTCDSASSVVDAATTIPSTDSGVSEATYPGLYNATSR